MIRERDEIILNDETQNNNNPANQISFDYCKELSSTKFAPQLDSGNKAMGYSSLQLFDKGKALPLAPESNSIPLDAAHFVDARPAQANKIERQSCGWDPLTKFSISKGEDSFEIKDPNEGSWNIKTGQPKSGYSVFGPLTQYPVTEAKFNHTIDGKPTTQDVGITDKAGHLQFKYVDQSGVVNTIDLLSANVVQSRLWRTESDNYSIEMRTKDGGRIHVDPDGSTTFKDANDRVKEVFDANGNRFMYDWQGNHEYPSRIIIQGPMTDKQTLELRESSTVGDLTARLITASGCNDGEANYDCYTNGKVQSSNITLGAGANFGQVAVGLGVPLQERVRASVRGNELELRYTQGIIAPDNMEIRMRSDGTTTRTTKVWCGDNDTVNLNRRGNVVR